MKKINYKRITSILFVLCIILLNVSCRKYEENPAIVLKSKKQRLLGGYNITGFWVNGNDSTQVINNQLMLPNNTLCNINFSDADNQQQILGGTCYGKWKFVDKKEYLEIDISEENFAAIGPFLTKNPLKWEITKLVQGQVHLKVDYNSKNYVLQLHQN